MSSLSVVLYEGHDTESMGQGLGFVLLIICFLEVCTTKTKASPEMTNLAADELS